MRYCLILIGFLFLFTSSSLHANIIYVPGDSTTIQGGINGAVDGDTVMVAPGTYVENIDFIGKAITVRSEQGPSVTTIDGNQHGSVVVFHSGEGQFSVLDGFTLTNGTGTYSGFGEEEGFFGGGVACVDYASPTITNNIITGNTTAGYLDYYIGYGGGISCLWYSSPTISKNIITGNSARDGGGGISCLGSVSPTISNNTISGNSANYGGGIDCYGNRPTINNNIITDNSAVFGGGISLYLADVICNNNTLTGNSASSGGGGIDCSHNSEPIINNTIIWGNHSPTGSEIYARDGGNPSVTYSDIQGGWSGKGNIDMNPRLVFFHGFNCLLHPQSPCIDTGDWLIEDKIYDWFPHWPYWYPDGPRSDMGAYGGPGNAWWLR